MCAISVSDEVHDAPTRTYRAKPSMLHCPAVNSTLMSVQLPSEVGILYHLPHTPVSSNTALLLQALIIGVFQRAELLQMNLQ